MSARFPRTGSHEEACDILHGALVLFGRTFDTLEPCLSCDGSGERMLMRVERIPLGFPDHCADCHGLGWRDRSLVVPSRVVEVWCASGAPRGLAVLP